MLVGTIPNSVLQPQQVAALMIHIDILVDVPFKQPHRIIQLNFSIFQTPNLAVLTYTLIIALTLFHILHQPQSHMTAGIVRFQSPAINLLMDK